jgi:hypothetical protein
MRPPGIGSSGARTALRDPDAEHRLRQPRRHPVDRVTPRDRGIDEGLRERWLSLFALRCGNAALGPMRWEAFRSSTRWDAARSHCECPIATDWDQKPKPVLRFNRLHTRHEISVGQSLLLAALGDQLAVKYWASDAA